MQSVEAIDPEDFTDYALPLWLSGECLGPGKIKRNTPTLLCGTGAEDSEEDRTPVLQLAHERLGLQKFKCKWFTNSSTREMMYAFLTILKYGETDESLRFVSSIEMELRVSSMFSDFLYEESFWRPASLRHPPVYSTPPSKGKDAKYGGKTPCRRIHSACNMAELRKAPKLLLAQLEDPNESLTRVEADKVPVFVVGRNDDFREHMLQAVLIPYDMWKGPIVENGHIPLDGLSEWLASSVEKCLMDNDYVRSKLRGNEREKLINLRRNSVFAAVRKIWNADAMDDNIKRSMVESVLYLAETFYGSAPYFRNK
ncbi:hypothetical protein HDU96_001422, partial [Phlyctochytrium bullatum]